MRQYGHVTISGMNGESASWRAIQDMRQVDARRLRNWRLLCFICLWAGFLLWYWVR